VGDRERRARQRGKAWELEVARDMGDQRTGNRGTNTPDTTSERWGVECKALDSFQIRESHLKQAQANAGDKPWVIPMKEYGTGRKIVIMDYKEWLKLIKEK